MSFALDRLVLERGSQRVLDGVSLALGTGELVGLLGANGAGKSSLLGVLAGDLSGRSGAVTLDDQPLGCMPASEQARRRAVLLQQPGLQFDLSVGDVIAMGAYPFAEVSPERVSELVRNALHDIDMLPGVDTRYLDLSGGEQQRVHLARTLVQARAGTQPATGERRPTRYVLLDEPTAYQDPAHQQMVLRVAAGLAHDEAMGVLAVLHDINLAARWCDRVVLLAQGRIVAEGRPDEAITPQTLLQVYGVKAAVVAHPLHPGRIMVMFY